MNAVFGLLARHSVFLWSLFSSTLFAVFLHIVTASFLLCLHASLSVAATSQESVFQMPGGHMSLKHCRCDPVGSLLPVHHKKGPLECGRLPSISHVPAITRAFALRECISLVSQHRIICHLVMSCDSHDTSEVAHVKHVQSFLLVCMHSPRLTSIKQSADYTYFIYIDFSMFCQPVVGP